MGKPPAERPLQTAEDKSLALVAEKIEEFGRAAQNYGWLKGSWCDENARQATVLYDRARDALFRAIAARVAEEAARIVMTTPLAGGDDVAIARTELFTAIRAMVRP